MNRFGMLEKLAVGSNFCVSEMFKPFSLILQLHLVLIILRLRYFDIGGILLMGGCLLSVVVRSIETAVNDVILHFDMSLVECVQIF